MSTRGAIGLRLGGVDKVTYNHSDSYPTWLGKKMLEFVHDTSTAELTRAYHRLTLVYNEDKPTKAQVKRCLECGAGKLPDYPRVQDAWECLLRDERGDPGKWLTGSGFLLEYSGFLAHSLLCEWAYIVNLDERVVEIYRGFNQNPHAAGRYAALADDEYNGVVLVEALPFAVVQEMTYEMIEDYVTRLEG